MKQYNFLRKLERYDNERDINFVPFHFKYPINITPKAVLFAMPNVKDQPKSMWVPFSVMRNNYPHAIYL
ncbi:MAG: hypothetical protein ACXACY_28635 [Candidatus Hodarchaeales archaeon]|jgi:hypothetical protein